MCEQLRQVSLGLNAIKWRTPSSVSTGVYMVKISLAAEEFTCRLAIIR
jgi:hypothetical protein